MSRALDKDVKKALRHGNHEKVYFDVAGALTLRFPALLEIELLGVSHVQNCPDSFLQDGNAIGMPKIRLVQAFIHARQIFMGHLYDGQVPPVAVLEATSIMLLMDPEHLTAANTRRRFVSKTILDGVDVKDKLESEKYFIDSLLTSRLHRHTKSPVLWSYRRWLMDRYREVGLDANIMEDVRRTVFVSGERHPRNYYAWMHARYLVKWLSGQPGDRSEEVMSALVDETKQWCFAHHDDISGWTFLMDLLKLRPELITSVLNETWALVQSFHWRNESVWCFLRSMMVLSPLPEGLRETFLQVRVELQQGVEGDEEATRVLDQALHWVEATQAASDR